MLQFMIRCKRTIPQDIIQVEFVAHPMHLESIFRLVSFLHGVRSLGDLASGRDQYPFLALCASEEIASTSADLHPRGKWCRFFEASFLLWSVDISIDRLPPFRYSLEASGHLLPPEGAAQGDERVHIQTLCKVMWIAPPKDLGPKMAFYFEHFIQSRDGLIIRPEYTRKDWMHSLKIPLG